MAIRECVDRIAKSSHFARSNRLRAFLSFTVESLLEGRADQLNERMIAVEVYRRDAGFDPRRDPIVRSEAHRLRARLAAYYAGEGRYDPIAIGYPKGRYVPAIGANAMTPEPPTTRAHDAYIKGRYGTIAYGNTLDRRHLEMAGPRLQAALESEPEYVDALAELAQVELLHLYPPRGETAQILANARRHLQRALDLDPGHARSQYLLGHVEGTAQRPREALQLTESAVTIDPEDPEGRTMLAVRYASLGFWEAAAASCDVALALDPIWQAPHHIRIWLLTRMGRFAESRQAIDALADFSTSPAEIAIARFDLRLAEGDLAGARAALSTPESTFPVRPDLNDMRDLASALVDALQNDDLDARATLDARRRDGPRFWDHVIRLALALGEDGHALELLAGNSVNGNYRWLATEPLVRRHLHQREWQAIAAELHDRWLTDVAEVGPRLPASPPSLPTPAELAQP